MRTAPSTSPDDATGTATYNKDWSRVSEWRVPDATSPVASASESSGRVEKSRGVVAPESATL